MATRFTASISRMRVMRVRATTTPPTAATAPPLRPVPAPRGITGTSKRWATRTAAATCSVDSGKTTACGSPRSIVPSYSKAISSSGVEMTRSRPSPRSSSRTTSRVTRPAGSAEAPPVGVEAEDLPLRLGMTPSGREDASNYRCAPTGGHAGESEHEAAARHVPVELAEGRGRAEVRPAHDAPAGPEQRAQHGRVPRESADASVLGAALEKRLGEHPQQPQLLLRRASGDGAEPAVALAPPGVAAHLAVAE